MRELKFRAWDAKANKMILDISPRQIYLRVPYSERMEIMQFSGLHDKHGNEIYEGDIIKSKYSNFDKETNYVYSLVVFSNGSYKYKTKAYKDSLDNEWPSVFDYDLLDSEVVGNIYENNDLLKELD